MTAGQQDKLLAHSVHHHLCPLPPPHGVGANVHNLNAIPLIVASYLPLVRAGPDWRHLVTPCQVSGVDDPSTEYIHCQQQDSLKVSQDWSYLPTQTPKIDRHFKVLFGKQFC